MSIVARYDGDMVFARRGNMRSFGRDRPSALIMFGHEVIEEAHAPARAPALVDFALWRAERGAGDVQMGPRCLADEARQQLCRRDSAAMTAAGVLHVSKF